MKRLEYIITVASVVLVVGYALFNYMNKSSHSAKLVKKSEQKEVKVYNNTQNGVVAYITDVINNGSSQLKVSKEIMEGGYIPKEIAGDVACYVYELSGKKCNKKYSKDAQMYFTSSCAGCHGVDGKGTNGAYPDLTKSRLLGISKD